MAGEGGPEEGPRRGGRPPRGAPGRVWGPSTPARALEGASLSPDFSRRGRGPGSLQAQRRRPRRSQRGSLVPKLYPASLPKTGSPRAIVSGAPESHILPLRPSPPPSNRVPRSRAQAGHDTRGQSAGAAGRRPPRPDRAPERRPQVGTAAPALSVATEETLRGLADPEVLRGGRGRELVTSPSQPRLPPTPWEEADFPPMSSFLPGKNV